MLKKSIVAALVLIASMQGAEAGEYMTADQSKAVFTGKSFDGVYHKSKTKKTLFKAFEAADGTHNVLRSNGNFDKGRKWYVDDAGKHCTTKPSWDAPRCSRVKDAGNGQYDKYDDKGKLTHTLTNFRDGNQLK